MTAGTVPPVALYVHVPFCVSLCPYCDFVVLAGAAARGPAARIDAYLAALLAEIDLRADALDARWGPADVRPPLATVYLGGGTPSLLPAGAIGALLDRVRARFGVARDAEVTIEVNPGADDRGDLAGFIAAGVTRVSIGAQSLAEVELRRLGRRHGPADVAAAVADARAAGATSVGLDLLYDVPGQTAGSWDATLRAALDLAPDHLSLYALTLDDPDAEGLTGPGGDHLPTSAGARRWRERARSEQDDDAAAAAYLRACDALDAAGFRHYEISNWARPGHESRHNLAYWERVPYEAVGVGAHAFDGVTRRWNAARLDGYLDALVPPAGSGREPALPPGDSEQVDEATAAAEAVILGLRTDRGVEARAALGGAAAGALAWAIDERAGRGGRGRTDPAHPPRMAPLERGLRPDRLRARWAAAPTASSPGPVPAR